jgi:hypothetical protein
MKKFFIIMLLILFAFSFTLNAAVLSAKIVVESGISNSIILGASDFEILPEGKRTPPGGGGGP